VKLRYLDTLAYLLLFLGIAVAVFAFVGLRYDSEAQLLVIFTLVVFYVFWALIYHFSKKEVSKKLFLEYLLIGAICSVVGILVFYL
jgi:hypothetical protein